MRRNRDYLRVARTLARLRGTEKTDDEARCPGDGLRDRAALGESGRTTLRDVVQRFLVGIVNGLDRRGRRSRWISLILSIFTACKEEKGLLLNLDAGSKICNGYRLTNRTTRGRSINS